MATSNRTLQKEGIWKNKFLTSAFYGQLSSFDLGRELILTFNTLVFVHDWNLDLGRGKIRIRCIKMFWQAGLNFAQSCQLGVRKAKMLSTTLNLNGPSKYLFLNEAELFKNKLKVSLPSGLDVGHYSRNVLAVQLNFVTGRVWFQLTDA